jgi:integrase
VALESGLRRAELLGLTWDRVDFSRGVLRLEKTKSGERREVPMRQAVYEVLSALPGPREGRVGRLATCARRSRMRSRLRGWTGSRSPSRCAAAGTTSRADSS